MACPLGPRCGNKEGGRSGSLRKPGRRQFGIANRMLDRFVAQIGLDRAGIDAVVGQLEPTGMAQHVGWTFISNPADSPARSSIA
jgi:hypothetical protein